MHGPSLATLIVAASLGMASPPPGDGAPDALAEARRLLDRKNAVAAVVVLEDALPAAAGPSQDAVLSLLRQSYEAAAQQSEAAGRPRDAASYRENLRILARKLRSAPNTPTSTPEPMAAPARLPDSPVPPPEPASTPEVAAAPVPKADRQEPADPASLLPMPTVVPTLNVASGDAAFAAENYPEASRIYAGLAQDRRLPANRRDHWAYCRSLEVAKRINAHPQTETDWASIDAEIVQIRALSPGIWVGEYLRSAASDRFASRKKPTSAKTIVRGAAPEEPTTRDRSARPAATSPAPRPAPAPNPAPAPSGRVEVPVGRWQLRETANFRIHHADPALGEKVAHAAEAIRREGSRRWAGPRQVGPWQPKCDIYLYPTARIYAVETGQPEDSPGFSTMNMAEGQITERTVHLRADHPACVPAVLPHEVTHVILADHFTIKQIPRWADEGMAVLAEPLAEQQRRAADLNDPLNKNVLFPVDALMSMPYPDQRYWNLYYAQSVSLTRFLVEQGSHAQLVQFLQGSQADGFEAQLRKVYQIDGYADLQARWVAYARANAVAPNVAITPAPDQRVR